MRSQKSTVDHYVSMCIHVHYFQVLPLSEVPSLETWQASRCHLCSISVDNSRGIEDSGSHTLQVSACMYSVCVYVYVEKGKDLNPGTLYW